MFLMCNSSSEHLHIFARDVSFPSSITIKLLFSWSVFVGSNICSLSVDTNNQYTYFSLMSSRHRFILCMLVKPWNRKNTNFINLGVLPLICTNLFVKYSFAKWAE